MLNPIKIMMAEEEIAQKRRDEYDEQIRVLLSRAISEKGGILTKGFTEEEIEAKAIGFFKICLSCNQSTLMLSGKTGILTRMMTQQHLAVI